MINWLRSRRLGCAYRVMEEMNERGRPSRVCFWSFVQCVTSVLLYPADVCGAIGYRILCWRISSGRVKPSNPDDDIPF